MKRMILEEIELQKERKRVLEKFPSPGKEKAFLLFRAIDEIHFTLAMAKLHSFGTAFMATSILFLIDIIKNPEDVSILFFTRMLILAILFVAFCKISFEIIMYFSENKIEEAFLKIITRVKEDPQFLEFLHFIRMNSVPRDKHYGTLILQKLIKPDS